MKTEEMLRKLRLKSDKKNRPVVLWQMMVERPNSCTELKFSCKHPKSIKSLGKICVELLLVLDCTYKSRKLTKRQIIFQSANYLSIYKSGPGCLKLTMSLVNVSLKFQMCSAKASLILSTKNFSVFGYKVVKHLTS